jgi:hypothetical protein
LSPDGTTSADADAGTSNSTADGSAAATLTEDQHDWASGFCGIDTRANSPDQDGTSGVLSDIGSAVGHAVGGVLEAGTQATGELAQAAGSAVASAGQLAGDAAQAVTAADTTVLGGSSPEASGDVASAADTGAGSKLSHFLDDAGSVIAGAAVHAVGGAVPLGFLGAGATDALVAAKATPEEKFWYGMGSAAAGVFDAAAGAVEVVGGIAAAAPTGGLSLAVSAEGVNEIAGGLEAMGAGTLLMQQGKPEDGSGSGGDDDGGKSGGGDSVTPSEAQKDEYFDIDHAASAAVGEEATVTSRIGSIGKIKNQRVQAELKALGYDPDEFEVVQYKVVGNKTNREYVISVFEGGGVYFDPHISSSN